MEDERQRHEVQRRERRALPYGRLGSELDARRAFSPIFEKHDVDLVIAGHDHHYERTKRQNGVEYIVTGGGGAATYPVDPSDFSAFAEEVMPHLVKA